MVRLDAAAETLRIQAVGDWSAIRAVVVLGQIEQTAPAVGGDVQQILSLEDQWQSWRRPATSGADGAVMAKAWAAWGSGDRVAAVEAATDLWKTTPESAHVPYAYLLIGEYYFDANGAYKSLLAFQEASSYRGHAGYGFALYKLAWCYFKVGEYGKATDTMKSVVAHGMAGGDAELQARALDDLVTFFAAAGDGSDAYDYFNKLGKKNLIRAMLEQLGAQYHQQGKYAEAVTSWRRLIAQDPYGARCPEWQYYIVLAYAEMTRTKEIGYELDRLEKTYGPSSAWARKNPSVDVDGWLSKAKALAL